MAQLACSRQARFQLKLKLQVAIILVVQSSSDDQVVDIASVYVEDVPEVVLTVHPVTPVSEPKKENVTLLCDPLPPDETLLQVKWFLDGELLKKLPECGFK